MSDFPYEDIVSMPHHVSKTRPQMPRLSRAAQFAPFAALTGHDEAIAETARLTDYEHELNDSEIDDLNRKFQALHDHICNQPEVSFTYFAPDAKKAGGAYVTKTSRLRRIDDVNRTFILSDGSEISVDHIRGMESPIFGSEMAE